MADIDPGGLSGLTRRKLRTNSAGGFQRFFDAKHLPHERNDLTNGAPAPSACDDLAISHTLLDAVLAIETRALSIMGQSREIGYSATDTRADGTMVLIWASTPMSRDALNVALIGLAELAGVPIPGAESFADEQERLMSRAARRRLDAQTLDLQAAAAAKGIAQRISDGQLILGEGARQCRPHDVAPPTTASDQHPARIMRPTPEAAETADTGIADGDLSPAPYLRLVPREVADPQNAQAVLERIYPDPQDAVIPSLVFAGDRATGSAAQQAGVLLEEAGFCVGVALKRGVVLAGAHLEPPEGRITRAPAMLLRDPSLEAIVTALSLRRIVNYGLGFARCDGAALQLDPTTDRSVSERGIDVLLRACCGPFTLDSRHPVRRMLTEKIGPGRVILVSQTPDDPEVINHVAAGGLAATRQWGASGPQVRLLRRDGVLASAPLESRAHTRERLIYAGIHAFALVQAVGLLKTGTAA
ncbi:hypothetical protein [Roseovarius sp. Pro17]|uniref:hypothetical protein n=1 Tax=Roseovarius sp. Pro17 TaxID=3108175 RepID=UPI002D76AAC6|nr:hypothetical protein [Roseovarius sp. Pro17]